MGLIKAILGESFTFSCATHNPSTGAVTDADSVPAYRIYENETATPILTGSMAKLDDANTTGLYTEQIDCTAANGFEDGKTYTISMTAAVGGVTGGGLHTLLVETPVWSVATRTLTSNSTAPGTGLTAQTWEVMRGDTLSRTFSTIVADSSINKCQITVKSHEKQADESAIMAIDSTTGLLYLNGASTALTATFVYTTGVLTVPADVMAELKLADYDYDVQVWRSSGLLVETIEEGTFRVNKDVTRLV